MGAAGLLVDERRVGHTWAANGIVQVSIILSPILLFLLFIVSGFFYEFVPPDFWVKIQGIEGLDRSTDAVTAPTFNITLRVDYKNIAIHPWDLCGKGGSVVVSYAGVPLARGHLPDFCFHAGDVRSVPVHATGEGLGLPDELYERMERQRQRHQRVTLVVHVRIDELTGSGRESPKLLWCTAVLHGQPKGPFICPVLK